MNVIFLAKDRHTADPTFLRFLTLGPLRGHNVQSYNKKTFLAGDLLPVDVVCLKSYVDDEKIWKKITTQTERAVNSRDSCAICGERSHLNAVLRNGGVRLPRCAYSADDVKGLTYPIIQKSNALSAPRDNQVFHELPSEIDCERYFYQELIEHDGAVYKVYCIGVETFLVKESDADAGLAGNESARRQEMPISGQLREAARNVGWLTGLEVYGLDFVGPPDEMFLIDVNPFPSFRHLPQAAEALWDYLEKIAADE